MAIKEGLFRLTVDIDETLNRKIDTIAFETRREKRDIVSDALKAYDALYHNEQIVKPQLLENESVPEPPENLPEAKETAQPITIV